MVRALQLVAVILGGSAAYFLWLQYKDAVFVCVVLSASALFLSIRFQAKERLVEVDRERFEPVCDDLPDPDERQD